MACKCCIKMTPALDSGSTQVILTPSVTLTKNNKDSFRFRMASAVPSGGASLPVYITVNGANAAVYNKYGNPVIGSELPTCLCKCIFAYYGITDEIGHVSLSQYPVTFNCGSVPNS